MHRAGASALSELLQFSPPGPGERTLPCPCGPHARYKELRDKPLLTAIGPVQMKRPYHVTPQSPGGSGRLVG